MKTILILALAVCIGFCSCQKDSTPSPAPVSPAVVSPATSTTVSVSALIGTWQVVSDTTHSTWIASASNPTGNYVLVYTGTASDHFTFDASGKFDLSNKGSAGNGTYSLTDSQLKLAFSGFDNHATYQVSQLTDHQAVLIFSGASPGGSVEDIITLSR